MQIDFHHTVTYVVARLAGFAHRQADVIAYCAQYVDDATNAGTIHFDNGAMYTRISSAHKALDYRNFSEMANHHVWIPFHFLPGNGGKPAGDNPDGSFIRKIICRPGSTVAYDLLSACLADRNKPYGLHRLGVTMHVFADTWAHQGFAGVCHEINDVTLLDDEDQPDPSFQDRLKDYFGDIFDRTVNRFVGDALPLGHGPVLSFPDRPFLKWQYRDGDGLSIERNNTELFVQAAHEMCKFMQRFLAGDLRANVSGLNVADRNKLEQLFAGIREDSGDERHKQWLRLIDRGEFAFGPVKVTYKAKGKDSWKHQALGTLRLKDKKGEVFAFSPGFLSSDWKLFHDALLAHRFDMIHDVLPKYGICAA